LWFGVSSSINGTGLAPAGTAWAQSEASSSLFKRSLATRRCQRLSALGAVAWPKQTKALRDH
jgi:hypothetical protein